MHYFLGVEANNTSTGEVLHLRLIRKEGTELAKAMPTAMVSGQKLIPCKILD